MKLFDWLGPRGSLLVFCGIIWIQTGIGTMQGYAGQPTDAPHLLVPGLIRGLVWVVAGVLAIVLAPTRSIKYHKFSITMLGIMPVVQALSYLLSWVVSWSLFQAIFPTFPLAGYPRAEYTSTFWQAEFLLVVVLMLAPATWKMISNYLVKEESGEFDRTTKAVTTGDTAANEESDGGTT